MVSLGSQLLVVLDIFCVLIWISALIYWIELSVWITGIQCILRISEGVRVLSISRCGTSSSGDLVVESDSSVV